MKKQLFDFDLIVLLVPYSPEVISKDNTELGSADFPFVIIALPVQPQFSADFD